MLVDSTSVSGEMFKYTARLFTLIELKLKHDSIAVIIPQYANVTAKSHAFFRKNGFIPPNENAIAVIISETAILIANPIKTFSGGRRMMNEQKEPKSDEQSILQNGGFS